MRPETKPKLKGKLYAYTMVTLNNRSYCSESKVVNEEELLELKNTCCEIANGTIEFFVLKGDSDTYYFNKELLKQAVISVNEFTSF